ncbi:hypothetical protein M9458_051188 [Cirrhinus mrigala]|uniref:Uncharacterized protein n=1 Tax=Cirrhinus mrigala TaxID=683832 RepID=A0ABD0MU77_CIRMR
MSLPFVIPSSLSMWKILIFPPICKHAAAPAHHQPASSTCRSNEPAPSGPPSLSPVLHNSSLVLSPEPAASSRTPAAPPRSGLSAKNMASQIYNKDYVDLYELLSSVSLLVPSSSPPSPLVPSSSPKPPLIPSIPPEPELHPARPPEPELPPARPPEAALPPARPPEAAPPPAPPECPPEPAPPPAPPERPPVSASPKPGLPVLSLAGKALSFPKKILGGGLLP